MPEPTLKLQAFLAHAGIASRRKSEVLIAQGFVTVNGVLAHVGQRVSDTDIILYQGQPIKPVVIHSYFLVNKPAGLVSTVKDELDRSTVLSILPAALRTARLYPVGRLDQESQGLILLTDDGAVAHHLTHPSFKIQKTYEVILDRIPTAKALEHFQRGILLSDGLAKAIAFEEINEKSFSITLAEGRNRQVRRMWQRVGYEVINLKRVAFGPFKLEDLGDQAYKALTADEISQLKAHLQLPIV